MALQPVDLMAIHQLYASYSHALDSGDGESVAALFTADGTLDFGEQPLRGRTALAEFGSTAARGMPGLRHFVSNIHVQGDGDRATGTAYIATLVPGPAGPTIAMTGRYDDEFVRTDDEWRLSTRRYSGD